MNTEGLLRSTNNLGTIYLLKDNGYKFYPSVLYLNTIKRHGGA